MDILKRDRTIDIIRGFTIILVILGHCIQYGSSDKFFKDELYFNDILFKTIYNFHMPLFALVSGYLFYKSSQKKISEVIRRRISTLFIPIFSWKTAEYVIREVYYLIFDRMNIFSYIISYVTVLIYGFWFLWAIPLLSMIALLIEKVFYEQI